MSPNIPNQEGNGAKVESNGAKNLPRRQCIPIIYTKGTHYDVGFDVVSN